MQKSSRKGQISSFSLVGLDFDSFRHVDFVLVYAKNHKEVELSVSQQRKKRNRKIYLENLKQSGIKITRVNA